MNRRRYVALAATVSVGGCLGTVSDSNETETTDGTSDFDAETEVIAVEEGTYDEFEAIDEWLVGSGSLEADEERVYTGSQSARLTANDDDDRVSIVHSPRQPLDVTGYAPGLAVAADDDLTLRIRLYDQENDFLEYRARVAAGLGFLRHQFGITRVAGEPNLERVSRIAVTRLVDDADAELWIDDLHFVPCPSPGTVMIHFDGGYETDYTRALPILEEYDVPATTFVAPDRLREDDGDEGDRLTEGQLEELADAGWTIASHSDRGLPLPAVTDPAADIADAVDWLEANGHETGARYLSFPAGQYDEPSFDAATEYHELGFAGDGAAHGYVTNPHLIPRVVDPDADFAREAIELTAAFGGITSFVFYELDDDAEEVLTDLAESLAARESDSDLSVSTPAAIADEYRY